MTKVKPLFTFPRRRESCRSNAVQVFDQRGVARSWQLTLAKQDGLPIRRGSENAGNELEVRATKLPRLKN